MPIGWRLRALGACAVLPPLLSLVSFARLAARAAGDARRGTAGAPDDEILADYVAKRLRRLPQPWRYTCLRRSLVLFYLMRRGGRSVELHIGVRRNDAGALQAHAWLVKDGAPYLEPNREEHRSFRVIARFPERATIG
jgi:hypothetical protein